MNTTRYGRCTVRSADAKREPAVGEHPGHVAAPVDVPVTPSERRSATVRKTSVRRAQRDRRGSLRPRPPAHRRAGIPSRLHNSCDDRRIAGEEQFVEPVQLRENRLVLGRVDCHGEPAVRSSVVQTCRASDAQYRFRERTTRPRTIAYTRAAGSDPPSGPVAPISRSWRPDRQQLRGAALCPRHTAYRTRPHVS